MATVIWRGDATAVAQVDKFTPANVEIGDVFTLTCNTKTVSFTATAATVANVVDGLVAAWNASTIAEMTEMTAAAVDNDGDGSSDWLTLTADTAGKPFTVTASVSDAGSFDVTVTTETAGVAATNEKQRVSLPGTPTGGTFTLTFAGQTTGTIAYNASAATVETALEALSNIAAGDVSVSGNAGGPWTVEFLQAYAGQNVPLLTGDGTNITGNITGLVQTIQHGHNGLNEKQQIAINVSDMVGGWAITFDGETTVTIHNSSASHIQEKLEALSNIGTGNILVTRTDSTVAGVTQANIILEFVNDLGKQGVSEVTVDEPNANVTTLQQGTSLGQDEQQKVTLQNGPLGGTFTLTFQGQTTGTIAYDATAASVKTALEALSNVTTVAVTGNAGGPWTVEFDDPGTQDLQQMTIGVSSLTGSAVNVTVTQESDPGTNEAQKVDLSSNPPSGGTFTLTWDPGGGGETTAAIAYDASAATVQTALEGLATPGAGDFNVTGDDGGPWFVEFTGSYAATDVNEMTGDGTNLTGGGTQTLTKASVTASAGPNHVDLAANYSGAALPSNGDTLIFEHSSSDALYGLDGLASVQLDTLEIRTSYTGKIGLPKVTDTDYVEYRERYLQFATQGNRKVIVGSGQAGGTGSGRVMLDAQTNQAAFEIRESGGGVEANVPAVLIKDTHASSTLSIFEGDVGVCLFGDESGQFSTVTQRGGTLHMDNVTIGTLEKTGGTLTGENLTISGTATVL